MTRATPRELLQSQQGPHAQTQLPGRHFGLARIDAQQARTQPLHQGLAEMPHRRQRRAGAQLQHHQALRRAQPPRQLQLLARSKPKPACGRVRRYSANRWP